MRKINNLNCIAKDCLFKVSCANHASAGSHREEGGFTPEIVALSGLLFCKTVERKPLGAPLETYPENFEELGRGMIYRDEKNNLKVTSGLGHDEDCYYEPLKSQEEIIREKEEWLVASDLPEEKGLLGAARTLRGLANRAKD